MKRFAFGLVLFTHVFTGLVIGLTLSNTLPGLGWFAVVGAILASGGSIVVYHGEK